MVNKDKILRFMYSFLILIIGIYTLFAIHGCTTIASRKTMTEDCVIKMIKAEVPPLKALEICKYVYPQPKDIIPKGNIEQEEGDLE